tara:strand:+ start:879 stop:1088 length:210 start_codon:yes stop_codon:yes gene_type:complete
MEDFEAHCLRDDTDILNIGACDLGVVIDVLSGTSGLEHHENSEKYRNDVILRDEDVVKLRDWLNEYLNT